LTDQNTSAEQSFELRRLENRLSDVIRERRRLQDDALPLVLGVKASADLYEAMRQSQAIADLEGLQSNILYTFDWSPDELKEIVNSVKGVAGLQILCDRFLCIMRGAARNDNSRVVAAHINSLSSWLLQHDALNNF
jgi:hypothetical protein